MIFDCIYHIQISTINRCGWSTWCSYCLIEDAFV